MMRANETSKTRISPPLTGTRLRGQRRNLGLIGKRFIGPGGLSQPISGFSNPQETLGQFVRVIGEQSSRLKSG